MLYGIKNCDTVRKARKWLEANQQTIDFCDYRDSPLAQSTLQSWIDTLGWQALLNQRSTSFRGLSNEDKQDIDAAKALRLMLAQPTLIKRPVLVTPQGVLVGFSDASYQEWFAK
ncbi:ArsC family reductase [Shewanella sp. NIFS-20-20]|uniref:ArsC family reductase n=1 Tax=Shewanella sp. NIFS-20-20 TaxID=2853806 RepID=UPI001C4688D1|nr:ArsC family reductase [Shewanella sp. NIFS-20-20]MBV7317034.1 ArsC family reductase [Shewanella sp. NIFS-20-20]